MKTGGFYPHTEDNSHKGTNFNFLLNAKPTEFWDRHCLLQKKSPKFFDKDFRELFIAMTKFALDERATLEEVKKSAWYNGPTLNNDELKETMRQLFEESSIINGNSPKSSPTNSMKSSATNKACCQPPPLQESLKPIKENTLQSN